MQTIKTILYYLSQLQILFVAAVFTPKILGKILIYVRDLVITHRVAILTITVTLSICIFSESIIYYGLTHGYLDIEEVCQGLRSWALIPFLKPSASASRSRIGKYLFEVVDKPSKSINKQFS